MKKTVELVWKGIFSRRKYFKIQVHKKGIIYIQIRNNTSHSEGYMFLSAEQAKEVSRELEEFLQNLDDE